MHQPVGEDHHKEEDLTRDLDQLRSHTSLRVSPRPRNRVVLVLFIATLFVPVSYFLGPLRLSPYTIFLLGATPVCLTFWAFGKLGQKTFADYSIIFFVVWAWMSLLLNGDPSSAVETGGIMFIQTAGAYFFGRAVVRDSSTLRFLVSVLIGSILLLAPFALFESVTGNPLYLRLISPLGAVVSEVNMDPRLGFERAQVAFEHPILFGIFCASAFSLAVSVKGSRPRGFGRTIRTPIIFLVSCLSLSTGALLSLNVQLGLMIWNRVLRTVKSRWRLLLGLLVCAYLAIDVLSSRTPFHVFVTYATFNQSSSYNRILIWQYGSAEVWRHPFFGIGMQDWSRPLWMSASMDNFWLVQAVKYGIPGFIFIVLAFLLTMRRIGKATLHTDEDKSIRRGIMFSLIGTCVAICSVHLWNASYCWLLFILGASSYLGDKRAMPDTDQSYSVDSDVDALMQRPNQIKEYPA